MPSAIFLTLLCALLPAHLSADARSTVDALIEAFNQHDVEAMTRVLSPDLEIYYVDEKGKAALGSSGLESFREQMIGYFGALPSVRSELVSFQDGPAFVSYRERASWTQGDEKRSQSALAVAEIRDGKIRRVWYFPAEERQSTPDQAP